MKAGKEKKKVDSLQMQAARALVNSPEWAEKLSKYWIKYFESLDQDTDFIEVLFFNPYFCKGHTREQNMPEGWILNDELRKVIDSEINISGIDNHLMLLAINDRFHLLTELKYILDALGKEISYEDLNLIAGEINLAKIVGTHKESLKNLTNYAAISIMCRYGYKDMLVDLLSQDKIFEDIWGGIKYILRNIIYLDDKLIDQFDNDELNLRGIISNDYEYYIDTGNKDVILTVFNYMHGDQKKQNFLKYLKIQAITKNNLDTFEVWKTLYSEQLPDNENIDNRVLQEIKNSVTEYGELAFIESVLDNSEIKHELVEKTINEVLVAVYANDFKILKNITKREKFNVGEFLLKYEKDVDQRQNILCELMKDNYKKVKLFTQLKNYAYDTTIEHVKKYIFELQLISEDTFFDKEQDDLKKELILFEDRSQKIKNNLTIMFDEEFSSQYYEEKILPEHIYLASRVGEINIAKDMFVNLPQENKSKFVEIFINRIFDPEIDSKMFWTNKLHRVLDTIYADCNEVFKEFLDEKISKMLDKDSLESGAGNYWLIRYAPLSYVKDNVSSDLIKANFEIGLTEGSPLFIKNVCDLIDERDDLSELYQYDFDKGVKFDCQLEWFKFKTNKILNNEIDGEHQSCMRFSKKALSSNLKIDDESNNILQKTDALLDYLIINLRADDDEIKQSQGHDKQMHFLKLLLNVLDSDEQDHVKAYCDLVTKALSNRLENPLLVNRGTGAYFWRGVFKHVTNPVDGRVCRSKTEQKLIDVYNELRSQHPEHFPDDTAKVEKDQFSGKVL